MIVDEQTKWLLERFDSLQDDLGSFKETLGRLEGRIQGLDTATLATAAINAAANVAAASAAASNAAAAAAQAASTAAATAAAIAAIYPRCEKHEKDIEELRDRDNILKFIGSWKGKLFVIIFTALVGIGAGALGSYLGADPVAKQTVERPAK